MNIFISCTLNSRHSRWGGRLTIDQRPQNMLKVECGDARFYPHSKYCRAEQGHVCATYVYQLVIGYRHLKLNTKKYYSIIIYNLITCAYVLMVLIQLGCLWKRVYKYFKHISSEEEEETSILVFNNYLPDLF